MKDFSCSCVAHSWWFLYSVFKWIEKQNVVHFVFRLYYGQIPKISSLQMCAKFPMATLNSAIAQITACDTFKSTALNDAKFLLYLTSEKKKKKKHLLCKTNVLH